MRLKKLNEMMIIGSRYDLIMTDCWCCKDGFCPWDNIIPWTNKVKYPDEFLDGFWECDQCKKRSRMIVHRPRDNDEGYWCVNCKPRYYNPKNFSDYPTITIACPTGWRYMTKEEVLIFWGDLEAKRKANEPKTEEEVLKEIKNRDLQPDNFDELGRIIILELLAENKRDNHGEYRSDLFALIERSEQFIKDNFPFGLDIAPENMKLVNLACMSALGCKPYK